MNYKERKIKDTIGQKFGRLTLIKLSHRDTRYRQYWLCKCECGNEKIIEKGNLKTGSIKSCGCLKKELSNKRAYKHGLARTTEYHIWASMKQRCLNKKTEHYNRYGGRGVKVCKRWLKFENFHEDMGKRPSSKYSLDRINNDGNYCKRNCRWATSKEQMNNTSSTVYIKEGKRNIPLQFYAIKKGVDQNLLRARLWRGHTLEKSLTKGRLKGKHQNTPFTVNKDLILANLNLLTDKQKKIAKLRLSSKDGFISQYEVAKILKTCRQNISLHEYSILKRLMKKLSPCVKN